MRHAWQIFFCASMAVAVVMAPGGCRFAEPDMIELTLDHDNASADVSIVHNRAVIDITDRRGINGLHATLKGDEWPERIAVRLNLQGLESLEIQYGNITLSTGRSSNESPDPPLLLSVTDAEGTVQTASPSADVYYPEITRTEGGFEIIMPPHFFLEDYPSFSMRWIDFYR